MLRYIFFFKQKTAYEMRISDWSSDVCSSDLCHLIYPASTPWHAKSDTTLVLHDRNGEAVAEHDVQIACGGSLLWQPSDYFSAADLKQAGPEGYVIIRDATCRLFGYHGLTNGKKAFPFDTMFVFCEVTDRMEAPPISDTEIYYLAIE